MTVALGFVIGYIGGIGISFWLNWRNKEDP